MKKILFTLTIIITCIIFTPNVFAINYVNNDDTLNLITYDNEPIDFELYYGNSDNLNDYIVSNFNNDYFYDYLDKIKNDYISSLNYSDFSSFESENYYILQFHLTNLDTDNPLFELNFYSVSKNVSQNTLNIFSIFIGGSVSSSNLSTNPNFVFYIGGPRVSQQYVKSYTFNLSDLNSNYINSQNNSLYFRSNISITSSYDSSSKLYNVNVYEWLLSPSGNLFYYDSNYSDLSFKWQQFDSSLPVPNVYYWFWNMKINNSNDTYSLGQKFANLDTGFTITDPNIQDLGNNSYGLNLNTITNFTNSSSNLFTPIDITCTKDRQFTNDSCTITNTDFNNYNSKFTNFYHQPFFYIGKNGKFEFDGSKYYVLTIRLYSNYNLQPEAFVYHLVNNSTDFSVEDIYKVVVNDYSLYKDYQIVFKPGHTGTGYLNFFTIKFNDLSDNVSDLGENYSFGIYKTIKLSEFNNLPTNNDITNDYMNNNLSSISNIDNSSFFSNFKINDRGLSSFVTLPFTFINSLKNTTCSPITLPIPHFNNNVVLPCLSSIFTENVPTIWSLYKIIINGFLLYRIAISLFNSLKNAYDPNNDKIEVIDL